MRIFKSDGQTEVVGGQLLVYTITITNTGERAADGVVITDTVPANTTFVAASSTTAGTTAQQLHAQRVIRRHNLHLRRGRHGPQRHTHRHLRRACGEQHPAHRHHHHQHPRLWATTAHTARRRRE